MSTNIVRSKKFKALVAVLGTEEAAALAWNSTHPDQQIAIAETPATSKQLVDVQIESLGLKPARGRIYAPAALLEAQARVLKSGKAEVVSIPGDHFVVAVAVYRTDEGSQVVLQNLCKRD